MDKVIVYSSTYQTEAYLIQSLLKSKNIEAEILDDTTVSVMPLYSVAIGGVKVAVDEKDKEEALNIIEEDYSSDENPEFVEDDPDPDVVV